MNPLAVSDYGNNGGFLEKRLACVRYKEGWRNGSTIQSRSQKGPQGSGSAAPNIHLKLSD